MERCVHSKVDARRGGSALELSDCSRVNDSLWCVGLGSRECSGVVRAPGFCPRLSKALLVCLNQFSLPRPGLVAGVGRCGARAGEGPAQGQAGQEPYRAPKPRSQGCAHGNFEHTGSVKAKGPPGSGSRPSFSAATCLLVGGLPACSMAEQTSGKLRGC